MGQNPDTPELNAPKLIPVPMPKTEFSTPFLQGMLNRLAFGYHNYGPAADGKGRDRIKSLERRLEKYKSDGNTEWLIDAANYAMLEFMHPTHPAAHFRATKSDESPGCFWFDTTMDPKAKHDGTKHE